MESSLQKEAAHVSQNKVSLQNLHFNVLEWEVMEKAKALILEVKK